ncbi:WhiB family transcriptional regulator [Citricoccus sp. SGAir0253]|nr:WhiB family transcriptional regulator [Citricoccus sp. SGAir0253]
MGRPPAETARRLPGKLPSTRPEGSGPARTPVAPASGRPPAHPAAAGAHPSDRWKTADEWKLRAECSPADTELFFSKDPVEKRAALAICADCPVARECLAEAMAQEQGMNLHGRYGIRGGLQPAERLDLARGGPKRRGKPRAGRRKKTGAA